MHRLLPLFLLLITCLISTAHADGTQPAVVPEPPDMPSQIVSGENMSPDITITRKQKETITEYSVNGNVYMVKISPKNAPAYYMVDTDGDGNLETRQSDLQNGMNIPQWLLFSW